MCIPVSSNRLSYTRIPVNYNNVRRTMYGSIRNKIIGDYERITNTGLEQLYNKPNVKDILLPNSKRPDMCVKLTKN